MAMRKPAARTKSMTRTVYFLNGPNANLYGHTAGAVYGSETFEDLGKRCARNPFPTTKRKKAAVTSVAGMM